MKQILKDIAACVVLLLALPLIIPFLVILAAWAAALKLNNMLFDPTFRGTK
jgi:hypothetical protein